MILLAEDDAALRAGLADVLRQACYQVEVTPDGRHALALLMQRDFDLAIIDLGLSSLDGLDVLRTIRRRHIGLPVMVITARGNLNERINGLDAGADDYLIKPFATPEFEARVRALLRRHRASRTNEIRVGPLTFIPGQPLIQLANSSVELAPSELMLLELLAEHPGRIISKDKIAGRFQRQGDPPSDTAIEVCVHRLRRKLAAAPDLKIRSLRGFGYLLESHADG